MPQGMSDDATPENTTSEADIYISRNNQTHGPYPRKVVEDWISTRKVNQYDLACTDKTPWQPVGKLLWPHQFAKASSGLTAKQWGVILGVGAVIFVLAVIAGVLEDKRKSSNGAAVNVNARANAASTSTASPAATPKPTFDELQERANHLLVLEKEEYASDDLKPFDQVRDALNEIPKTAKEYKAAQVLRERLLKKSARIGAEVLVLGPKPTNSPWDGRVDPVVEYLKANLNDYDSSEFVEWSPVTKMELKGEPYWTVRLKLRAKNAFGAYILRDTFYFIRQNRVVRTVGL